MASNSTTRTNSQHVVQQVSNVVWNWWRLVRWWRYQQWTRHESVVDVVQNFVILGKIKDEEDQQISILACFVSY